MADIKKLIKEMKLSDKQASELQSAISETISSRVNKSNQKNKELQKQIESLSKKGSGIGRPNPQNQKNKAPGENKEQEALLKRLNNLETKTQQDLVSKKLSAYQGNDKLKDLIKSQIDFKSETLDTDVDKLISEYEMIKKEPTPQPYQSQKPSNNPGNQPSPKTQSKFIANSWNEKN